MSLESGRDILLTPDTAKSIKLVGNVVSAFQQSAAVDAGVVIADGVTTCVITQGSVSQPFTLSFGGASPVKGQLLFVRNDSDKAANGIAVDKNSGALFVYTTMWVQVL